MITLIELLSQANTNAKIFIKYENRYTYTKDKVYDSVSDLLRHNVNIYQLYKDAPFTMRHYNGKDYLYIYHSDSYECWCKDMPHLNEESLDFCYAVCKDAIKNGDLDKKIAYKILGKSIQEFELNNKKIKAYGTTDNWHTENPTVIKAIFAFSYSMGSAPYAEGLSYHFAEMLKRSYDRGEIVLAAPESHMYWIDTDGIAYDIFSTDDNKFSLFRGINKNEHTDYLYIPIDHLNKTTLDKFTGDNKDPYRVPKLKNIETTILRYDKFLCSKYNYKF